MVRSGSRAIVLSTGGGAGGAINTLRGVESNERTAVCVQRFIHHFDVPTLVTIFVTFLLFVAALFFKGFTHDLLLEAGVFLVSVKLILMGYRQNLQNEQLKQEMEEMKAILLDKTCDGERR